MFFNRSRRNRFTAARNSAAGKRRGRTPPLRLEALEDRLAPATFTDNGTTLNLVLNTASTNAAIVSTSTPSYTLTLTGDTWSGTNDGNVTGNGTATLSGGGGTDAAILLSGTQTLGGTGTVLFNNSTATGNFGYPPTGMFLTANNTTVTIGPDLTLHGGGAEVGFNDGGGWTEGVNNASLVVQGTIDADSASHYIYVDATNWTNSGTLAEKEVNCATAVRL